MPPVPKISVCIPTYNRAGYLSQCLASILDQTVRDFEVVVSDNCSTDATGETVRAFGDPRVRYLRNASNIGVFRNMNQCLDLARGDYVCILHDDDLYAPRFLEHEAEMLDCHPGAGFVHCAVYEIDASGARRRLVKAFPQDCVMDGRQEFVRYLGGHNVCCSTVMVRRELYRRAGAFDTALLCSDWLMWLQLALLADVAYVAEPLASMRVHNTTLSSSIEPSRWCQEFLTIAERGLSMAEAACPSLVQSRESLMRRASTVQARRFFIAALAALTDGAVALSDGYVATLHDLERKGAPRRYARLASLLRNPAGQGLLSVARRLRRTWEARDLPVGTG